MRRAIPVLLAGALVALPLLASAQLLGPLVQCEGVPNDRNLPVCQACNAIRLGQNIINFFVAAASFIGVGMLIYAGFLLLTSGGNTSGRDSAKRIIWNVLIGLVIVLIAWLAIDTVMKKLFEGSALYEQFQGTGSGFGPWNQIECVGELVTNAPAAGSAVTPGQQSARSGPVSTCPSFNPHCSPATLQSLGLSAEQANAMSCVAMTENSGFPAGCSGTGPCGTFQISQTNWRAYAPAGCGAENFSGNITRAQNNSACNAQTMAIMLPRLGYQPWTGCCNAQGNPWNTNARACVASYDRNTNLPQV